MANEVVDETEEVQPTVVGSITLNYPNLDEDADVEVHGLGVFKNGKTNDVTEAQATAYQAFYGEGAEYPVKLPPDPVADLVAAHTKNELKDIAAEVKAEVPPSATKSELASAIVSAPVAPEQGTLLNKDEG